MGGFGKCAGDDHGRLRVHLADMSSPSSNPTEPSAAAGAEPGNGAPITAAPVPQPQFPQMNGLPMPVRPPLAPSDPGTMGAVQTTYLDIKPTVAAGPTAPEAAMPQALPLYSSHPLGPSASAPSGMPSHSVTYLGANPRPSPDVPEAAEGAKHVQMLMQHHFTQSGASHAGPSYAAPMPPQMNPGSAFGGFDPSRGGPMAMPMRPAMMAQQPQQAPPAAAMPAAAPAPQAVNVPQAPMGAPSHEDALRRLEMAENENRQLRAKLEKQNQVRWRVCPARPMSARMFNFELKLMYSTVLAC